jgi:hypothetical protein
LQGCNPGHGHCCRLIEARIARFLDEVLFASKDVFGEAGPRASEDLISFFELGDPAADGFDSA